MNHPLFSHHDHHVHFKNFDKDRSTDDFSSLLGYAKANLRTADGARPPDTMDSTSQITRSWPAIQATGYGHAVTLGCPKVTHLGYTPENIPAITQTLQSLIKDKITQIVYDYCVR